MNNPDSNKIKRNLPMDILRVIACIMVINMHVVSDRIYESWTDAKTALAVFDCVSCIAVPLFFMLSGAFSNNDKIFKALKKSVYLFALFVLFKLFYNIMDCYWFEGGITWDSLYYSYHITDLTSYKYHLWYLPDFIVVTLISPVLNSADRQNPKISGYLAILFVLFGIVMPSTFPIKIWGDIKVNAVGALLEGIPFNLPMGIGYYCVGKTIYTGVKNGRLSTKHRIAFATVAGILWIIANVITSVRTINLSVLKGTFDYSLLGRTGLPIFVAAILLFFMFSMLSIRNERFGKMTDLIVPNILFIYLIHPIFIDVCTYKFGFVSLSFNPLLAVPIKACLIFVCSFIVSLPITNIVRVIGSGKTDKKI